MFSKMEHVIPITLFGENLGKRHLYLNTLVNETYTRGDNFEDIKDLPEKSAIDRLFKIDLASKFRNVDYIIQNVKDEDMLFVSRALKAKWLLERKYEDIINPHYLENILYPAMVTTAVTKMQHWIHLNLNDESRCERFYQHYKDANFDLAIKYLLKCSKDVIKKEFSKIIHRVSPHYFKIFCEKCPEVANIFFDSISKDDDIKNMYLDKEKDYFRTLRHLLKTDGNIVLNITEKYFNRYAFDRFSPSQTKIIIRQHQNRFWLKPELYSAWLLNMQAIADSLSGEEAKDLVIKLAQAKYLTNLQWFNYKAIEPLIKRVDPVERAVFKKKVFVDKDIGEEDEEWPYETPAPPVRDNGYPIIFEDREQELHEYSNLHCRFSKKITKRKYAKYCSADQYDEILCCESACSKPTLLDRLFNEFRFASFGKTLYDLRKRIAAESSPQNREFMMLVLISKSGGRLDAITSLLELLAHHSNEPINVRAAIIRSLAKRSQIWRLPEISWSQLLKFGQGLGLDGNTSDAPCVEGLHAVVIRCLLLSNECQPAVQNAFLNEFSTLSEYSVNAIEKKKLREELPKLLFSIARSKENVNQAVECIEKLINTLNAYNIKIGSYPGLIYFITALAEKDISNTSGIIMDLYRSKIARRELFHFTFSLEETDASYTNALKHDAALIDAKKFSENYAIETITNTKTFLSKLSLYFGNDLAITVLSELKKCANGTENIKILGRLLAILLGTELECYLNALKPLEQEKHKFLAVAIKSNAHKSRPLRKISFDPKIFGVKYIATKCLVCRTIDLDEYIKEILKLKKTTKLALALSKRTSYELDIFSKFSKVRPTAAVKAGLKRMNERDDNINTYIWLIIKPLIQNLDVSKPDRTYVKRCLQDIHNIPMNVRPDFSIVIYDLFKKISLYEAMPPLCYVENLLPSVNENVIQNLLTQFVKDDFVADKLSTNRNDSKCNALYMRILIKFILLSKTNDIQKQRLDNFAQPFLTQMKELKNNIDEDKKKVFKYFFSEMLLTFKYNKAFINTQYVSPLPVMEKIVAWTQNILPMEMHFNIFVQLHLSMLYFKSLRRCVDMAPDVFADDKRKRNEGVKLFGNLFGKYIAKEVNNLKDKYFESVIEIYKASLIDYLDRNCEHYISSDFLSSLIKGILEGSKDIEYLVGVFLLKEKYYDLTQEHCAEINEYINGLKYKNIEWFLSAYLE